jgi:hypothetical protein
LGFKHRKHHINGRDFRDLKITNFQREKKKKRRRESWNRLLLAGLGRVVSYFKRGFIHGTAEAIYKTYLAKEFIIIPSSLHAWFDI